jgi:hypothetical protein
MDQNRRLKRQPDLLLRELRVGLCAKFLKDQRQQFIGGVRIAELVVRQDCRNDARRRILSGF